MILTKRVYDTPTAADGHRVLVDRLWPRGLTKERARVDNWLRELGPSPELREWYSHDLERFPEFRRRYRAELEQQRVLLEALAARSVHGRVTLVYASKDGAHCNAAVLKERLDELVD